MGTTLPADSSGSGSEEVTCPSALPAPQASTGWGGPAAGGRQEPAWPWPPLHSVQDQREAVAEQSTCMCSGVTHTNGHARGTLGSEALGRVKCGRQGGVGDRDSWPQAQTFISNMNKV